MKLGLFSLVAALLFTVAVPTQGGNGDDRPTAHLAKPTPVAELFNRAIKYGGFTEFCLRREGLCVAPPVLVVSFEDDNIDGRFNARTPGYVEVSADSAPPGSIEFNETLVHEFVHYLQWLSGKYGPFSQCQDTLAIEAPAYAAGEQYLAEFGIVRDNKPVLASIAFSAALCGLGY